MRLLRFLALLCIPGVLWVVGSLLWSVIFPTTSRMDAYAAARIRNVCGYQANCKVGVADLFEGDWDTVYVFGARVSQQEIDQILGRGFVRAHDRRRIVVLERNHRIVRVEDSPVPTGTPHEGQIEFEDEDHREQRIVRYDRGDVLRVTGFPLESKGTFYVLTSSAAP